MAHTEITDNPIQITIDKKEFCPPALRSVHRGAHVHFVRNPNRKGVVLTIDRRLFGVDSINLNSKPDSDIYSIDETCPLDVDLKFSCEKETDKGGGGIETMSGSIRVTSG